MTKSPPAVAAIAPADGCIDPCGQGVATDRRRDPEHDGQDEHVKKTIREQVCGRRRHDQHGDDQNRAYGLEGADHGHRHGAHEDVVHEHGRDPERGGETRIETRDLQLLVERDHESQVHEEHDSGHPERFRSPVLIRHDQPIDRRQADLSRENAVDIEVHLVEVPTHQNHAHGKERRKRHPDRRVFPQATRSIQEDRPGTRSGPRGYRHR